eukprot:6222521-Ditylum_brightwellii.AAC.2
MHREVIARQLMHNGGKHQYLNDNQYSGHNGRAAPDIVLGKSFTMDTVHFQQENMGATDCNAQAYYDRIILFILLLTYLKAGLDYHMCVLFATILCNMQYHITTAFGIASQVNFFNKLAENFGIGQGSTDGPVGWTMISDVILKHYHKMYKGFKQTNSPKQLHLKCKADMLMDDNTLLHNDKSMMPHHTN